MNAQELRIGNIYLFQTITGAWKPSRPLCNVMMQRALNNELKLKPIPLTEQWLLDFGFESNPYQDRYEIESMNVDCSKLTGNLQLWESTTGVLLTSVHQLQNLYFALTGKELLKL